MDTEPNPNRLDQIGALDLKDKIELAFRSFVIAGSIIYFIGFLIVHTHLWLRGYYSFELVSLQYLVTGIVALIMPTILGIVFVFYYLRFLSLPENNQKTFISMIIIFAIIAIASIVILKGASIALSSAPDPDKLEKIPEVVGKLNLLTLYVLTSLVGAIVIFGPAFFGWLWISYYPRDFRSKSFIALIMPVFTVLGIIGYAACYTFFVYQFWPPHLGGGASQYVQVVVDQSAEAALTGTGIVFSKENNRSEIIRLYHASRNEYVFGPCGTLDRSTIILQKEHVPAILTGFQGCPRMSPDGASP